MQKMLALVLSLPLCAQVPDKETLAAQAEQFRALMRGAPRLALQFSAFPDQAANAGWAMEMVSSVAVEPSGAIYLLQRGAKADPVIVADPQGRILRTWGKGLYKIPHSIRVDPAGNIWT